MFYRRKNEKREGGASRLLSPLYHHVQWREFVSGQCQQSKKKRVLWGLGRVGGRKGNSPRVWAPTSINLLPFSPLTCAKKIRRFFSLCGILRVRAESTAIFSKRRGNSKSCCFLPVAFLRSKEDPPKNNFASCGGWRWERMMATWVMFSPSFH